MVIKNILVHVDLSSGCVHRLQLAADLAQRCGARLIGIGLADDDLETVDEGATAPAEESFRILLQDSRLPGEWYSITGLEGELVARHARTADLVIVGQRDPAMTTGLGPEEVVVACGRPVLVVPHAAGPHAARERVGDTVLIAWNGSREATRAVHDARPILALSRDVVVLSVATDPVEDWGGRGLAYDLIRRGVHARSETVEMGKRTMSETVLGRATDLGADLVVMGAFSRSPLREMILGGMTHAMLRDMTVPVLMAH